MKDDRLFIEHYEPGLIRQGISNVVLRIYQHISGSALDDPSNSTELVFSPRAEVDRRMAGIFSQFGESKGIAITSLVSWNNLQRYLFLLDCSLPVSAQNEARLITTLRDSLEKFPAIQDGILLRTQNSYHVVGFRPLELNEWHEHMANALLLSASGAQVSDMRYIGHSIMRGYGSLRISDYLGKPTPDFICRI